MTYKPKVHGCPYRTSDGKCVHKDPSCKKTKRKRFCGHEQPKNCQMYNEWVELVKMDSHTYKPPKNQHRSSDQ